MISEKASELLNIPLKNGLYIVSTPIGNKLDITLHALKVLKEAEFVLCEDTRKTNALLQFHGIDRKQLLICNEHAHKGKLTHFLNITRENSVALVSDAGTPLVCDPGYDLVQMVRKAGVEIFVVPGACALVAGATLLGVNLINTTFLGFYQKNSMKKMKEKGQYALFVAPHDMPKLVEELTKSERKWEMKIANNVTKETQGISIISSEEHLFAERGEIIAFVDII